MSINLFFFLILGLLMGMYGYFTPSYSPAEKVGETPKIELSEFTLYEISSNGIDHILEGKEGKKFETYYEVTSAKFSDNTKKLFHSIRSDTVDYRNDILKLEGNVHYVRADGLELHSNEGLYNTKASMIETKGPFVITQEGNRIDGHSLQYDIKEKRLSANQIRGTYQLK
jgi:LPS export ABC transporter protein LptC